MSSPSVKRHKQLVTKYFIPNMGDYSAVGSELSSILDRLDTNQALSPEDKQWIRHKGLFDLSKFVEKLEKTGHADFSLLRSSAERQRRKNARQELWEKYGIDYIDDVHLRRMIEILLKLESKNRLSEKDVIWLSNGDYFYTYPGIKQGFHKNEARFYRKCFEKSRDPWQAINASSHYRKAKCPNEALNVLSNVDMTIQKEKRLKAALCTTKGGCMRDLSKFDEAIRLADIAHSIDPNSFHPCTLLGAVNYEIGNFILGKEWFTKAIKRGANSEDVDQELRYIFMRADKIRREGLKHHLLDTDSVRYSWVNDYEYKHH